MKNFPPNCLQRDLNHRESTPEDITFTTRPWGLALNDGSYLFYLIVFLEVMMKNVLALIRTINLPLETIVFTNTPKGFVMGDDGYFFI